MAPSHVRVAARIHAMQREKSQIPPVKPEAWKTMDRSKRL